MSLAGELPLMRQLMLASILALGLVAVPFALADDSSAPSGPRHGPEQARVHANETNENETLDNETADVGHHGNHTGHNGTMEQLVAAFKDAITACHAKDKPDNATKEEQRSWAHCIRDAFRELRDSFRAERKEHNIQAREANEHAGDHPHARA